MRGFVKSELGHKLFPSSKDHLGRSSRLWPVNLFVSPPHSLALTERRRLFPEAGPVLSLSWEPWSPCHPPPPSLAVSRKTREPFDPGLEAEGKEGS